MANADKHRTRGVLAAWRWQAGRPNTVPAASSPRGAGKRVGCYHATQRDAAGTVMGQLALFFIPNLSITSPYFAEKTKFLCAYGKFRNILPHAA